MACFVVLVLATNGCEPVRIFARHFWDEVIAATLKRARLAESQDGSDTHKIRMPIRFTPADEHTGDLLPWMRAQIEAVKGLYAQRKQEIVTTVGLEDGGIHGTISFAETDWNVLIDHQLGLSDHAPVSEVTIRQRRFGIDAAEPMIRLTPDWARIRPHPRPCRVRLRSADGAETWINGDLIVPALPGIPPEQFRVRLTSTFLDVVSDLERGGVGRANLTWSTTDQYTFKTLRALIDILRMARQGVFDVSVRYDGQPVFSAGCSLEPPAPMDWLDRHYDVMTMLDRVAGIDPPADCSLSIEEVEAAWNQLVELNGLVTGGDLTINAKANGTLGGLEGATSLLAYDYADVGAWSFMAVVSRPIVSLTWDEGSFSLACGMPRVVEGVIKPAPGAAHLVELATLYHSTVKAEGGGALSIFDGVFRDMTRFLKSDEEGAAAMETQPAHG